MYFFVKPDRVHVLTMHKWKYIWAFFYTIFIVFMKLVHSQDYPDSEPDEFKITTEMMIRTHETSEKEELNIEITDESKMIRIFLVGGPQLRAALRNRDRIWKHGIIPYIIHNSFTKRNEDFILNVIEEFHNKTCVRFKPRKNEKSYISIMPGSGCSAGLGQFPRVNPVKLGKGCFAKGIVIHELMHTLGFIHEQNRPDRDNFVKIDFDNVLKGSEANFRKYSENQVNTFNQTYDYGSVMHYGAFDFAKNKSKPTVVPLQEGVEIGQRGGFSEMDLIRINLLYNCNERNNTKGKMERNEGSVEDESKDESGEKKEKLKRFRLFFLLSKLF